MYRSTPTAPLPIMGNSRACVAAHTMPCYNPATTPPDDLPWLCLKPQTSPVQVLQEVLLHLNADLWAAEHARPARARKAQVLSAAARAMINGKPSNTVILQKAGVAPGGMWLHLR